MAADTAQLDDLKGLPIKDLILSPIKAASDGAIDLGKSTLNFVNEIGFDTDKDGKTTTRCLEVDIERPVKTDGDAIKMVKQKVKTPVLSLVQIPNVGIDDIEVKFNMEISAHTNNSSSTNDTSTDSSTTEGHASVGGKIFGASFDVGGSHSNTHTGSVTSQASQTRDTNFSSSYLISVSAKDKGMSEGMGRLTQMLAEQMNVIDASSSSDKPK
jgi:hypothetical protein|tara:strand:- start:303 stop:941 length:639 start_codon:yes stop_codon:yes gene_type:complete